MGKEPSDDGGELRFPSGIEQVGDRWRYTGGFEIVDVSLPGYYVSLEDRLVPEWAEFKLSQGPGNPTIQARVELREGVPQCVALAFTSGEGDREIRQSDLRSIELTSLVVDLMAVTSLRVDRSDQNKNLVRLTLGFGKDGDPAAAARRFIERQRRGPGLRDITPELLQRVATVYRENVSHAPTQAVGKAFGVKSRMASTYVQRARERGFLPPTTQGKKQA